MAFNERSARALAAAKVDYGTPVELYEELDASFHFTIDLAAHERNAKHRRFWSPQHDSLAQSWEGETGFLNPPFGRGVEGWLAKARDAALHERAIIVQLLPARVGTAWWRRFIETDDEVAGKLRASLWVPETRVLWLRWDGLFTGIHFHSQRVQFEGAEDGAKFDTAVVIHASPNRAIPRAASNPASIAYRWGAR
jgi:site-specific DNA-methyltransferase (adenine-specific)